MKTSLHLLVKDEVKQVHELIKQAEPYFDKIYITVSDRKAYHELERENIHKCVSLDYREWTGKFDEARQHNWDKGKDSDYSFWIDADDSFDFTTIPYIFAQLEEYDAVFLPYLYDFDENGNCIVKHPRERAINRRKSFYWKGWVHENLICEEGFTKIDLDIPVIHKQDSEHRDNSLDRNHEILLQAVQETKDPRYLHYLGISYFTKHQYKECITVLEKYIEVGGWDEEVYRSVLKISEAYFMLGDVDNAVYSALKGVAILPEYPQGYHLLAHYESQVDNHAQAIEWGKVALSKPMPKAAAIYDPTSADRTRLTMAISYFALGEYETAYKYLKSVKTINTSDVEPNFRDMAEVMVLKRVIPAITRFYDMPKMLWEGMNSQVKYLPELRKVRELLTEPKKWADNSIVFFCGKGYEEWGPHTLDKGMGGSEEAIVYLSRELARLGYRVVVYGEVSKPFGESYSHDNNEWFLEENPDYGDVEWFPWNYIDKRDKFSTLVIWRAPQFVSQFKAKKMFVDVHDQLPEDIVKPYKNVTYLFKSQYHKDQYPKVTDYKIIGNGIDPSQFKTAKKKPYSVIYPSAYYRGLETLLKIWPQVKHRVPEATLDIYYGWNSWVGLEGKDDFYNRMVQKFEDMKDLGVTEHGRVDHKTLADKYAESKVWAYPTEFPEIHCITALKANLAGCKPVITDVAALKETGGPNADYLETDTIYTNEYAQQQFTEKLIKALKEEHDVTEQVAWAKQFSWANVAKQWKDAING